MALIVYGGAISPFVRKVRIMLAEKGVPYRLEQVNPFTPPPGAYVDRLHARPSFKAMIDEETPLIMRFRAA